MKHILLVISIITLGSLSIALSGCEEDEHNAALKAKPEVTDVGTFDGCTVKYVNRGENIDSFFMARCSTTTSLTQNYLASSGKATVLRRGVSITDEINQLQEQKDQTDVKLNLLKSAVNKLTPTEQAALGLRNKPADLENQ